MLCSLQVPSITIAPTKILLTRATWYIRGSILPVLLKPSSGILPANTSSVLVRSDEKAAKFKASGVTPILFQSLDESDLLRKIASEHDESVIINTASGYHTSSAKTLALGLGDRVKAKGARVHYSGDFE
ncbi:hypothetical protein BKA65DRAFT_486090 [Rhexocercosporidium sp. MPI-PUGE-AT-0058]|nr:hypothetical protein BKA65DRAFT_486090 [Rhexocercosporidium sp. MPI-PUGE-AT-0058]